MKTGMLKVPGASLYYQVTGSGPWVLLLNGGSGDADGPEGIVSDLEVDHTVVTYDRRGYARSPLEEPSGSSVIEVPTQGDDAYRLLQELGSGSAIVVGTSLGALIGLELAARHPEQIRRLVAHEPPAHQLLPESERPELPSPSDKGGLARYAASMGVKAAPPKDQPKHVLERRSQNARFFLTREAPAARTYLPDFEALKALGARVVIAGGEEGRDYAPYRCAAKVAERLGRPLVEFPGNHAGPTSRPLEFARRLRAVLAEG